MSASANARAFAAGDQVLGDRYKILESRGKGDVVEVYLAEQAGLDRRVQLKLLRADLGIAEGMETRFREVAKTLAAVDHANVVRVVDFGLADGRMYLVTEEAEGRSLRSLLKAGEPLMPDRAVALLIQMADALAAIHAKHLVHRDVRPENVQVSGKGNAERARLADFGFARLVDPDGGEPRVTVISKAVGDPRYLSPEQAAGAPADARSDLYALGVIAYELLSGAPPFAGEPLELQRHHLGTAPAPLAQAAPHLSDHIRLCETVMKLLEKDPKRRFASAAEVSERLARLPPIGEPTVFVTAMQAPVVPPTPRKSGSKLKPMPKAPGEVFPSLLTPKAGPTYPGLRPAKGDRSRRRGMLFLASGAAGALMLAGLLFFLRATPADAARAFLEESKPTDALEGLEAALRGSPGDPELQALKAAALHGLGRHKEELTVLRDEVPPKSPFAVDPAVLAGLVEDWSKGDSAPKEHFKRVPKDELRRGLEKLAQGKPSAAQWGALRYLDTEGDAELLDLSALYAASLESQSCAVKRTAAKRLGQLGAVHAADALEKLKAAPRPTSGERNCGQDEAAVALTQLKKKR